MKFSKMKLSIAFDYENKGLALFRLNEYNTFGLLCISIVFMRCRK